MDNFTLWKLEGLVDDRVFYGQKCNPIFGLIYFKARGPYTAKIFFETGGHVEKSGLEDIDSCILWIAYHVIKTGKPWKQASVFGSNGEVVRYKDIAPLIEDVWGTLTDIPFTEDELLDEDWFVFSKGTDKYEIWHWFDEAYPDGVAALVNGDFPAEARTIGSQEPVMKKTLDVEISLTSSGTFNVAILEPESGESITVECHDTGDGVSLENKKITDEIRSWVGIMREEEADTTMDKEE